MKTAPEAGAILTVLHLPDTRTNREQLTVLVECLKIFDERNSKYKDLWKEVGQDDNLHHMKHKVARVDMMFRSGETDVDDALDLINYAVFFIRNGRTQDERVRDDGTTHTPLPNA